MLNFSEIVHAQDDSEDNKMSIQWLSLGHKKFLIILIDDYSKKQKNCKNIGNAPERVPLLGPHQQTHSSPKDMKKKKKKQREIV